MAEPNDWEVALKNVEEAITAIQSYADDEQIINQLYVIVGKLRLRAEGYHK